MNFLAGHIVKFEPTEAGRRRATQLAEEFPRGAVVVPKTPHHVELLTDFIFKPTGRKSSTTKSAQSQTADSVE